MQVVVLANEIQKTELLKGEAEGIVWIKDEQALLQYSSADAFIDLQYSNTEQRNALLIQLLPKLVVINSVADTLREINPSFVRINGWTTFLASPVIEAACLNEKVKTEAEAVFSLFHKKPEWLADEPGFLTARVVSMIINEAYLAFGEGVSSKEEMDTAMQLGTAYPYGPFKWAEKIGAQKIVTLLQKLSQLQPRYTPSDLLVQEAAETT
jgi:3-hydroxybutyryl-CoA dehydrogenase